MPSFRLNGEAHKIEENVSLQEILERFKIRRDAIAVAVNETVIPRSELEQTQIKEGDCIELVRAVGGG